MFATVIILKIQEKNNANKCFLSFFGDYSLKLFAFILKG